MLSEFTVTVVWSQRRNDATMNESSPLAPTYDPWKESVVGFRLLENNRSVSPAESPTALAYDAVPTNLGSISPEPDLRHTHL